MSYVTSMIVLVSLLLALTVDSVPDQYFEHHRPKQYMYNNPDSNRHHKYDNYPPYPNWYGTHGSKPGYGPPRRSEFKIPG